MCALFCTTVVHNDMHTHEQFLTMSVGLGLGFVVVHLHFVFLLISLAYFVLLLFAFVAKFLQHYTKRLDRKNQRTSPK